MSSVRWEAPGGWGGGVRGRYRSGRILLNKSFHAGWGRLNVPRWERARMPPAGVYWYSPLPPSWPGRRRAAHNVVSMFVFSLRCDPQQHHPPSTHSLNYLPVRIDPFSWTHTQLVTVVYLLMSTGRACWEHYQVWWTVFYHVAKDLAQNTTRAKQHCCGLLAVGLF